MKAKKKKKSKYIIELYAAHIQMLYWALMGLGKFFF